MDEGNSGLMDVSEIWILACTCCVEVRDCNKGPSCARRPAVPSSCSQRRFRGEMLGDLTGKLRVKSFLFLIMLRPEY